MQGVHGSLQGSLQVKAYQITKECFDVHWDGKNQCGTPQAPRSSSSHRTTWHNFAQALAHMHFEGDQHNDEPLWRASAVVVQLFSPHVKTTHERCGPFSLVVLSQRRGRVTTLSGPTLSETLSSLLKTKLSQNYSTLTQVRSRTRESKLTLHAVVVFWLKQTKQRKHRVGTPSIPSRERTTPREPKFHTPSCSSAKLPQI